MPDEDRFKNKYRISSARLKDYDYSKAGMYFVTICVKDRECCLGEVKDYEMVLSEMGRVVKDELLKTPQIRKNILLDEWVIMPNHVHAIIEILEASDARVVSLPQKEGTSGVETRRAASLQRDEQRVNKPGPLKPGSLGAIIGSFKSACTKEINLKYGKGIFVWQARFYDHVITNEKEYYKIAEYIADNPAKWAEDRNNPINFKK